MIGNKAMKIVLSILISLFTVICFSACAGDSRAVEPDAAGSDTGLSESEYDAEAGADKSYEDILRGHYLRGHMWDYTDLGSGASNDDPYFERYWTVAYDPLTKECTDVAEEEYFELDMGEGGYDYSEVEARKRQLEEVFADMDFVDVEIDNEGAMQLAKRSRGTPRLANRLLKRVRDFAQVRYDGVITGEVARDALDLLDVDHYGLEMLDRKILETMITKFDGGPVGLDTLAATIGEDSGTIEDVYEPYLLMNGFITRTPRGRQVTPLALRHLGYPLPDAE